MGGRVAWYIWWGGGVDGRNHENTGGTAATA